MSTIDDAQVIRTILENNGYYPEDPQVKEVCVYFNRHHTWSVKISYRSGLMKDLTNAGLVAFLAWSSRDGITKVGTDLIAYIKRGGELPAKAGELK